jgi:hypothetical protein
VHILRDQLVTLRQERIPRTPFIHGCGERLPDLVPGVEEGVVSGLGVADEGGIAVPCRGADGFEFLVDEFVEHTDGDVCFTVFHFVSLRICWMIVSYGLRWKMRIHHSGRRPHMVLTSVRGNHDTYHFEQFPQYSTSPSSFGLGCSWSNAGGLGTK